MKVKVRVLGTNCILFEGNVRNTVFTDQTVTFQSMHNRIIGELAEIEFVVVGDVYPHVSDSILTLHRMRNDTETAVFQALDNAQENGYKQAIVVWYEATLLSERVAELEHSPSISLLPYIERWRTINQWKENHAE